MRVLIPIAVALLALHGCSRKPTPPAGSEVVAGSSPEEQPGSTIRGDIAGVPYLEHMLGGARRDDRVPMIVALHAMGGDPAYFLKVFRRYRGRARLVLPYGHLSGGMYIWYDSVRDDVAASVVTREADRIATALATLTAARPTLGKPLVTGFSQGGIMTFALAVTHPEVLAAAFPISGMLPPSLYPSAALSSRLRPEWFPPVVAFHGASDLAVPPQGARASIAELRRAGYTAELREYTNVAHDISTEEESEVLERIGRVADGLGAAP